ncbi:hypothetical protein TSAR_011154 [Trichomalopsis sarcophagae]|uniref:Uncharacterized protein n=1 Tax=Trichomalopsis sarcophagae TaxID=543379 RepID=A0A232FGR9_9HYME|nr:hypothetical protein TSAR_011154 [Trichomalopsis sarcophagae]
MQSYLFSLIVCFASMNLCLAYYYTDEQQGECLFKNGLNNSTDIELFKKFTHTDSKDQKVFPLEDQFSCAVACVLNLGKPDPSEDRIYHNLLYSIKYDDQIPGELKRDMIDKLDHCHRQDEGDDCKLFICIKLFRSPFKEIIISIE